MGRTTAAGGRGESWRQEAGFTLIEVVVASVILLVVLVPSAYLLTSSSGFVAQSKDKVAAANLAAGLLEEDRATTDAETWSSDAPSLIDPSGSPGTVAASGTEFTLSQRGGWCAESSGAWASYSSTPGNPPAYGVLATVTWQAGAQSVEVGTILATPSTGVSAPSSGTCPL